MCTTVILLYSFVSYDDRMYANIQIILTSQCLSRLFVLFIPIQWALTQLKHIIMLTNLKKNSVCVLTKGKPFRNTALRNFVNKVHGLLRLRSSSLICRTPWRTHIRFTWSSSMIFSVWLLPRHPFKSFIFKSTTLGSRFLYGRADADYNCPPRSLQETNEVRFHRQVYYHYFDCPRRLSTLFETHARLSSCKLDSKTH